MKLSTTKHNTLFVAKKLLMVTVVLLGGLFFGAMDAVAQSEDGPATSVQWVTPNDAVSALNQEIANLDQILLAGPNEPLEYKRKFYSEIAITIEQDVPIPAAVDSNYARFTPQSGFLTSSSDKIPNPLSAATWLSYYQEVTDLLQI